MIATRAQRLVAILAGALALACDAAGPPGGSTALDAGDVQPPLYSAEKRAFRVVVEAPRGSEAILARVEPKGEFHLSTEFPSKLEIAGTGPVELAGPLFTRTDASVLTEERVEFTVPYRREGAGVGRIAGAVTFGLCEEDLCERVTERFEGSLP